MTTGGLRERTISSTDRCRGTGHGHPHRHRRLLATGQDLRRHRAAPAAPPTRRPRRRPPPRPAGWTRWSPRPRRRARSTSSPCRRTGPTTARSSRRSRRKYGVKVDQRPARRLQRRRDHRGQEPQGPVQGARRLRPQRRRRRRPTRAMFAPYKVATFAEVPAKLKDADGTVGQRLRRLHEHRLRPAKLPAVDHRVRPAQAAVQGQGRPQRRPDQGRRRLQRRAYGRRSPRAARPTTSARASTSSAS